MLRSLVIAAVALACLSPSGAALAAAGQLNFEPDSVLFDEAGGSATLTVTRSGGSDGGISVDYAFNGATATAGADYISVPNGTLSWPDGDASPRSFTVAVVDDSEAENSETVVFVLSNAGGGAVIGGRQSGGVIISDNDVPVHGRLNFDPDVVIVNETAGNATLTVTRSEGSQGSISVDYAYNGGGATAGTDYIQVPNGTLSWSSGDTSPRSITVTVLDDTEVENTEVVVWTLSNAGGGAIVGPRASGAVLIEDNDAAVHGRLNFDPDTITVDEAAGSASLTVTRSEGSQGAISVDYAYIGGDATAGTDYAAVSPGTLSWSDGDTSSRSITVTVLDDSAIENTEIVALLLSNPGGSAIVGTRSSGAVLIYDNDADPLLSIVGGGCSVDEGDGGTVGCSFTFRLSQASARAVSFTTASADGTATTPGDYTSHAAMVHTIPAGETNLLVVVPVVGETTDEADETFSIVVSDIVNATPASPALSGTGTIRNDDPPPLLAIADVSVTEGDTGSVSADFVISLQPASSKSVTVNYATVDGTATAPADYVAVAGSMTFDPGITSKFVTVAVRGDTAIEPVESLFVNLGTATNADIADSQGQGSIGDDDDIEIHGDGFESP